MAEVRKRVGGVLLLILLSTSAARTQAITGTILGTITDESGAVLPGVTVTAINADTGLARTVATDESGNYSISNLRIGSYRLESELVGFKKAVRGSITLDIDSRLRIDLEMVVGQRTDVVDVSTTRLLLQADDSSVGTVIDRRKILDLPLNGRQFELLVQLVPGAVTPAQGSHLSSRGGFNIGGMDEHYNSFFLDGIDNVDPIIRNFSFRPSIDLIQEFKVQETGYNAEFGRNAGAVVNVTTRSGTNVFHGSAWEFLRNDHLDARNYFAPKGTPKASLIRNQFGATLGGPLVQGKTFFFLAYEGGRQKAGSTRRASVPTPLMRTGDLSETGSVIRDPKNGDTPFSGGIIPQDRIHSIARAVMDAYPLPNLPNAGVRNNRSETGNRIEDTNDISVKLDHQLMPGTSITGRYSYSVARIIDVFRTESGGGTNLANFGQVADRIRTNAGLSFTTVGGKSFVNEARIGYNRFKQPQIPINDGPAILQPLQGLVKTFLPFTVTGYDLIGNPGLSDRVVNVYNYIDNISYTARNHQLKAGVDVRRYLFNAFAAASNSFAFDGSRSGSAFSDFLLGLPVLTRSVVGSPTGNPRKVEAALYIQDDWKVSRRLTLNYGLRWEFYGRMNEKVNKQSTWVENCNCMKQAGDGISERMTDNDLNNFAPRFGFAFTPFSESATVVRGAAGIFYDNDQRTNFQFIANPPFLVTQEFRASQIPTLSMDNPFPSNTGVVTLSPSALPPHYVDTYAESWNLGVQHELYGGTLLDVSYVGNHTVKATRLRNINQPVNGVRPFAGFAAISLFEQAGSSNFHSMQARGERRFAQGFSFISSYTWGHAIDDRPGQGGGRAQNNYNMRAERADADFDVRHRWTLSALYDLPFGAGRRFGAGWNGPINALFGGWGIDGISTMQGGRPFTVSLGQDISGTGNGADRPNLVSGVDLVPKKQGPDNWINKSAFTPLATRTFGTAGRNIGRGPRLHTLDISLGKHQRVGDNLNVQFRAEFFNALNHPNFALPAAAFDSPVFGTISSTSTSERQIQFGLRLDY